MKVSRRLTTLLLLGVGAATAVGCVAEPGEEAAETGQMNLPLTARGPSGTSYRLRNAFFIVHRVSGYYEEYAGSGPDTGDVVLSSETDPNAPSISVSLEEGRYSVQLQPGWSFEKQEASGATPVEATLLSNATQSVWIYRQSTSWSEFSFGIGGREVWLNGKLNIEINVQEQPGSAGAGGAANEPPVLEGGAAGSASF